MRERNVRKGKERGESNECGGEGERMDGEASGMEGKAKEGKMGGIREWNARELKAKRMKGNKGTEWLAEGRGRKGEGREKREIGGRIEKVG